MTTRDAPRLYAAFLAPTITRAALVEALEMCKLHARFIKGVAVAPCHVLLASTQLRGFGIEVIAPIAYPLGLLPSELKHLQAQQCAEDGPSGIAAVMKIEALRADDAASARADAEQLCSAAQRVALIANTACLSTAQSIVAGGIAVEQGAAFVTNTGLGMDTHVTHISTVRAELGRDLFVVAAGGIRNARQVMECLDAGANAVATSHAVEIARQLESMTYY